MLKRVAFVVAVVTATTFAGTDRATAATIYLSEATFISNSGALSFESFEGLSATNSNALSFMATLPAFGVIATPAGGVYNLANFAGTHATDGAKYIVADLGPQQAITFTFAAPITEFGVTITDYGDVIAGASQLTFLTNTGVTGAAVTGPRPDANDQFFGLIDANPFTSISFTTPFGSFGDPFSVDRVYSSASQVSAVPEPTSALLLGTGVASAWGYRRGRRLSRARRGR